MPGSHPDHGTPTGYAEPGIGLTEAKAPLPYLRSRNALKIILDLDGNFGNYGKPKVPEGRAWAGLPGLGKSGGA